MTLRRAGLFFPLLGCALAAFLVGALAPYPRPTRAQSNSKSSPPQNTWARKSPDAQQPASQRPQAKAFSSPQEAAAALYSAAQKNDEQELLLIFGPRAHDVVVWSQYPADRKADLDVFVKKYQQMHRLVKEPDSETTLYVGAENWPLPIPLVEINGQWYFDAELGSQEILYRRIGENESDAIDVLGAMVDAENEFYEQSAADAGAQHYAQRLNSSPGQRNGLYWPEAGKASVSPAGSFVARASYNRSDHKPLYGYYFRVLTQQGPDAPGGAKNYLANGKMTGGFALLAFPAEYRSSGVKTFIVDQDAVIYEKDLGRDTAQTAAAMTAYNPDPTWTKVR